MDAVTEAGTTSVRTDAPPEVAAAGLALGTPERLTRQATIIAPNASLSSRVMAIWRSRELLGFLIRKELKVKYKGSVLGFVWSMLNPAIVLIVYFLVFRFFLKSPIPHFALYLFSGLIVWNLFATALMGSSSAIVANAGIVKKVAFPREVLALAQVGTATIFFFLQAVVLVVFLVGFQLAPAWNWLPLLPFAFIDLLVLISALALFLSAVNVYLRDVEHLVMVLLQAWFWGVPIIYSFNRVYDNHHWLGYLFLADPVTPIVLTFQRVLYAHVSFAPGQDGVVLANYPYHFYVAMLAWVLGVAILLLIGSLTVFGRIEGNFAEEL
jgi:ABC-2 type transport system permease protein